MMGFGRSGRVLAVLHWFLAVIMPFFAVFGRILYTGELGWLGVIGIFFGPLVVVLLLIPPLLTLLDREARHRRSVRIAYGSAIAGIARGSRAVDRAVARPRTDARPGAS